MATTGPLKPGEFIRTLSVAATGKIRFEARL
jgi:hypothetical protein